MVLIGFELVFHTIAGWALLLQLVWEDYSHGDD